MRKEESACYEADLHHQRNRVCRCGALHDIIHLDAHSASGSASKGHCLGGSCLSHATRLVIDYNLTITYHNIPQHTITTTDAMGCHGVPYLPHLMTHDMASALVLFRKSATTSYNFQHLPTKGQQLPFPATATRLCHLQHRRIREKHHCMPRQDPRSCPRSN